MHDDDVRETPPAVVGAVALGTAPLPFLAVYAVLFLIHGSIHPVNPPDVTSSTHGEFIAGWIATALFVATTVSLLWLVNGRRRWPFAIVQFGILVTAIDFLIDPSKGGSFISSVIVVTTLLSLVLGFAPQSWRHVDRTTPPVVERVYALATPGRSGRSGAASSAGGTTPLPQSSEPSAVLPAGLRRRRVSPGTGTAGDDTGSRLS